MCGCVQSIFQHLQTVFIIQIIPLLPHTLEPVVHRHTAEEDIRSLMSYHHSGLWLEINMFVRATSSVSKCSFELYSMQSFRKDAILYNIQHLWTSQHAQQISTELRFIHKILHILSFLCVCLLNISGSLFSVAFTSLIFKSFLQSLFSLENAKSFFRFHLSTLNYIFVGFPALQFVIPKKRK